LYPGTRFLRSRCQSFSSAGVGALRIWRARGLSLCQSSGEVCQEGGTDDMVGVHSISGPSNGRKNRSPITVTSSPCKTK
jgi:hypothetical protein